MELDDDLFFADLSKQISLLIMDDDDDDDDVVPVSTYPSFPFQDFRRESYRIPSPFVVEQNCRRESKGTGVFIPKSTQPRRRHRHGRHNSFNSKSHRQMDNSRKVSNQVSLYPKQP